MGAVRSILAKGKTFVYERVYSRRVAIKLSRPIYTFTFDDVPTSAGTNGVPVLDGAGVRASFYVATKLGKQQEDNGFLSVEAISHLHHAGHHIGCHTYSHYRLSEGSAKEMYWDALKNRLVLSEALGGVAIEHFSYPFGKVSFRAKKLLNPDYKTLRSNRAGINHGIVDLTFLRAVNLYSKTLDRKSIGQLILKNANLRGWLIFYTHAVEPEPNAWGTTTQDLRWVVEECMRTGGEILSVKEAYEKLEGPQRGKHPSLLA